MGWNPYGLGWTSDRAHYANFSGINVVEFTRFPFILETSQVSFSAKRVLVQGLLERFWLLVQALMVLSCPYSPHATVPFRCTVKHSWSILHFSGGHFVMLSIVDRLRGKSL